MGTDVFKKIESSRNGNNLFWIIIIFTIGYIFFLNFPTISLIIILALVFYLLINAYKGIYLETQSSYERRQVHLNTIIGTTLSATFLMNLSKVGLFINFDSFVNGNYGEGLIYYDSKLYTLSTHLNTFFSILLPEVLLLTVVFVVITFSYDFIDKAKNLLESATHLSKLKDKLKENNKDIDNLIYSMADDHMETFVKTMEQFSKRDIKGEDIEKFYKNLNTLAKNSAKAIKASYLSDEYRSHIEKIKINTRNKYLVDHNTRFKNKQGYLTTFAFYSDVVSDIIKEFNAYNKNQVKFLTTFSSPIKDWFEKDKSIQTEWGKYLNKLKKIVSDDKLHIERLLLYIRKEGKFFDGKEKAFFQCGSEDDKIREFYMDYHTKKGKSSERNSFICDINEQTLIDFSGKRDYLRDFFVVYDVANNHPILALGIAEGSSTTSFELITIDFTDTSIDKYEDYIKHFVEQYRNEKSTLVKKKNLCDVYDILSDIKD